MPRLSSTHYPIRALPLALILLAALALTGCDSSSSAATVTARAEGTATAVTTLTALAQITPTRTATPTETQPPPPPTEANPDQTATLDLTTAPAPIIAPTIAPTATPNVTPTLEITVPFGLGRQSNSMMQPAATKTPHTVSSVIVETNAQTNVRATPSLAAAPIGNITGGQRVTATGRYQNWLQIEFAGAPDGRGWLALSNVKVVEGDVDSLPVVENLPAQPTAQPTPTALAAAPRDSGAAWYASTTLYTLFVRSFRDSNGDGIGDLQGVIEGLDYLQALGVDGLWLLPIFEGPTYHGYAITDYYTVEADYGTNDDLLRLIGEVHKRGMYIFLDYVANHTSNQHPFFKDAYNNPASQYSDFYVWRNDAHTDYATFSVVREMPKINYEHEATRKYMIDVAMHWMDPNGDGDPTDGVDGYRCDVALEVPLNFWAELRKAMSRLNPRSVLLGEVWSDGATIARFLRGDGLDTAFDFPVFSALAGQHNVAGDGLLAGRGDATLLRTLMLALHNLIAPNTTVTRFTNNHDTDRVMSDVNGDMERARMAAVWLLTAPGVPQIYYGEEIGMRGLRAEGPFYYDEYRREPMDWYAAEAGAGMATWFKPPNRSNRPNDGVSVEEQQDDPNSLLSHYRALLKLRREHDTLRGGSFEVMRDALPLYVLRRWTDDELILVIINFGAQAQQIGGLEKLFSAGGRAYADPQTLFQQSIIQVNANVLATAPAGYAIMRLTAKP